MSEIHTTKRNSIIHLFVDTNESHCIFSTISPTTSMNAVLSAYKLETQKMFLLMIKLVSFHFFTFTWNFLCFSSSQTPSWDPPLFSSIHPLSSFPLYYMTISLFLLNCWRKLKSHIRLRLYIAKQTSIHFCYQELHFFLGVFWASHFKHSSSNSPKIN